MARRIKLVGGAVGIAALLFGAITWFALEGRDVVVLRTRGPDGAVKETRTWIADKNGVAFVESAHGERPFFRHLIANPEIDVVRGGTVVRYRASPVPNPDGHAHIRRLLAEKYGWADRWVALLQEPRNRSRSGSNRTEPDDPHGRV